MTETNPNSYRNQPDERGHFGGQTNHERPQVGRTASSQAVDSLRCL